MRRSRHEMSHTSDAYDVRGYLINNENENFSFAFTPRVRFVRKKKTFKVKINKMEKL